MTEQQVLIIGAGPAGLTAGLELLRAGKTGVTIVESTADIGGLSKTVNHKGNRIDIGGHRFFSKSSWVMDWWRQMMPIARPGDAADAESFRLAYQGASSLLGAQGITASESDEDVLLIRSRLSRIYFGGQFFDYPLKPGLDMAMKMGPMKCLRFGASYARSHLAPIQPENTLEDFFINRFGRELYLQFFKEYTEKVWGVPCHEISAAWGAQRIKSLSIAKALKHAARKALGRGDSKAEQTSLIESFLYPKYGPGQMWEGAAKEFEQRGGRLIREARVVEIQREEHRVTGLTIARADGSREQLAAAHVISTMPMRELVQAMRPSATPEVEEIAKGLQYRDFITVGLLYRRRGAIAQLRDNWIYIQEPGVKVGRVQVFNNWSPYMVADPDTVWVGLEFFARDDDALWALDDGSLKELAVREMEQLGLGEQGAVLDATVIRMPKAYPGYFGDAYEHFDELRGYLDGIKNLYLIGRNGMHRYNNQDHSMLSARLAAQSILAGKADHDAIWAINVDDAYHEEAEADTPAGTTAALASA